MTDKFVEQVIKISIALLLATVLVFTILSVSLAAFSDKSYCVSGKYYVNDRPVFVDGEHLECKRLRLER